MFQVAEESEMEAMVGIYWRNFVIFLWPENQGGVPKFDAFSACTWYSSLFKEAIMEVSKICHLAQSVCVCVILAHCTDTTI